MGKEFWDRIIDTNLGGTFLCTKHVLPQMEAQRSGQIVNVYGGTDPSMGIGACVYGASKDAVRTFTRFVAEEERDWNICVVAVAPGAAIATEDAPEDIRSQMPGPDYVDNLFVLASQVDIALSGHLFGLNNGRLVVLP